MLNFVTITGVEKVKVSFFEGVFVVPPNVENVLLPVAIKNCV
jgi:hypothetical protein